MESINVNSVVCRVVTYVTYVHLSSLEISANHGFFVFCLWSFTRSIGCGRKKIQRKARWFSKYWWLSVSKQKQRATIIFFKMMCFVFNKCKISNKHINQCESNCDTSEHYCMLLCRGFLSSFLDFCLLLLLARNSGAPHNQLLSIFYYNQLRRCTQRNSWLKCFQEAWLS